MVWTSTVPYRTYKESDKNDKLRSPESAPSKLPSFQGPARLARLPYCKGSRVCRNVSFLSTGAFSV